MRSQDNNNYSVYSVTLNSQATTLFAKIVNLTTREQFFHFYHEQRLIQTFIKEEGTRAQFEDELIARFLNKHIHTAFAQDDMDIYIQMEEEEEDFQPNDEWLDGLSQRMNKTN